MPSATLAAIAWKIGLTCGQAVGIAARHDRRALEGPFLAARDARADKEQPLAFRVPGAPGRVGEMRVAAVDQDVARLEQRDQLVDHVVDGRPALTMIMILRGGLSAATSSSTECVPTIFLPLARPVDERVDLGRRAVEHGDGETVALHVQDEVFTHHGQADQADVGGLCALSPCVRVLCGLIRAGVISMTSPDCTTAWASIRRCRKAASSCADVALRYDDRDDRTVRLRASARNA